MKDGIARQVEDILREIEEKEHVKILHAVESGSRAWGFASPDSDYDVRFIYVRQKADYLSLNASRDVIEWQLDELLDINGWDLKKALIQFRRGNATLFEWSNSPVVYKTTPEWARIYDVAKNYFSVKAAAYHYYGTAASTYCQYLQGEEVRYKKYFYALRPLLAGAYIQKYQCPPPVLFAELMEMELPDELRRGIEELLEIKKMSDEKHMGRRIPVIHDYISEGIGQLKAFADGARDDKKCDWNALNDVFFKSLPME